MTAFRGCSYGVGGSLPNNAFVEPYLTGRKRMPSSLPGYYSPGDESEAEHVAVNLRSAWKGHRVSVAWLKAQG